MNGIAWLSIVDAIFPELCPNFSSDPQAPLELIKQTAQDENNRTVTLAGSEHYCRFQLAAFPLMTESKLKLDLTSTFLDGLDPCIRKKIGSTNPNKGAVCSRGTDECIKELCSLLQLITLAEKDIKSTSNIVKDAMAGGTFYNAAAQVNASVAKRTLQANQETGKSTGINQCWGCKSLSPNIANNSWWNSSLCQCTCPNPNVPGVKQAAAEECKAYSDCQKTAAKGRRKKKADVEGDAVATPATARVRYKNLTEEDQKQVVSESMSALGQLQVTYVQPAASPTRLGGPQQGGNGRPNVFLGVPCFAALGVNPLPVSIKPKLPHFLLQIG